MSLMQLYYASTPFGFSDPLLNNILARSRHNNERDGITGALICRGDLFLQLLEGPRSAVTATFQRILGDDRHLDVMLIGSGYIKTRLFPKWHMRDDPARSWMWTQQQVNQGAVDAASSDEVRAVFERLASEA